MLSRTKYWLTGAQKQRINNVQSVKNKRKTPINSNANYRKEMKLVPINMNYCQLQFDALKFFLGLRLNKLSLPNFILFNVNPHISQRNRK